MLKLISLLSLLVCLSFLFVSCKKDFSGDKQNALLYSSNGNFLILIVEDKLEEAYEYHIETLDSLTDTIPLFSKSIDNSLFIESVTFLKSTNDTLFKVKNNLYTFLGQSIPINKLGLSTNKIQLSSIETQLFSSMDSSKINTIWEKVAHLKIANQYRKGNNKTIGFQRIVQNIFNDDLGFAIPKERYLVYLIK